MDRLNNGWFDFLRVAAPHVRRAVESKNLKFNSKVVECIYSLHISRIAETAIYMYVQVLIFRYKFFLVKIKGISVVLYISLIRLTHFFMSWESGSE